MTSSPSALLTRFTYEPLPGRVVFRAGAARDALAPELERLGVRRALVVATEAARPLAEELAGPLGERVAGVFDGVRPHVPVEVAQGARQMAASLAADGVLSIGGGSTTGTAKAVALETGLPIVAVPTTYAGSEVTPVWGLTEGGRKTTGRDAAVLPRVVVYDPELTVSLPPAITGPSAMNAIAHCVEAFYAPGANPVTSLLAEEGIRALRRGAVAAVADPGDLAARSLTLYGAYLAGSAFAVAGSGLHHKICHGLGGAYDLPHAELHTVVLPHVVAFNAAAIPAEMDRVARALDAPDPAAALFDLGRDLGAPAGLKDIGLPDTALTQAVAVVLENDLSDNPRTADAPAMHALLEDALAGTRPTVG